MVRHCSLQCGMELLRTMNSKKIRKELVDYRKKNKSLPSIKKEAQQAFNEYVRFRDHDSDCVSCDKEATYGPNEWDCGHYRTVGSANHMRFNLHNAFKQCKHCNSSNGLGGNCVEYRKRLVCKFGEQYVLDIEYNNAINPMGKDYYERIKRIFKKKTRMRKKRLGIN